MEDINEYERERLETIAANRLLLEELGLQTHGPSKIPSSKPSPSQTKTRKRKSEVVKTEVDEGPRRRSGRLRGLEIDSKELVKIQLEEQAQVEEAKVRATRPRSLQMSIAELGEESLDSAEAEQLASMLAQVASTPHPRPFPEDSSATYADSDTPSAALENLKAAFKGVKLRANAKVTNERVFSMAVHPDPTKNLVFVGDKRGQLGIWDATAPADDVKDEDGEIATDVSKGRVYRVQAHSVNSISAIRVDPVNGSGIYTSSYDASIRHLSLATGISTEIFAFPDTDNLITHLDITPSGQELWCSDKNGGVSHVDIRETGRSRRRFRVVPENGKQKLGGISINPLLPHLLCTAGLDGQVRIWDARHLTQLQTQPASSVWPEPPTSTQPTMYSDYDAMEKYLTLPRNKGAGILRASWLHGKSCTSAYWDPWGRRILTTSYDDKLRVWDSSPSTWDKDAALSPSHFQPKTSITHNTQTGRWLSVLRAQWSTNMDTMPHFTVGNMRRTLDVFAHTGEKIVGLWEDGVTAVPAVTASHPSNVDCVVGGNGSGKCQLWSASSE